MKEKFSFSTFIRECSQRIFFDILSDFEGQIAIVWEPSLMKQLNVIVPPSVLKEHNLKRNFSLDDPVFIEESHLVYLISPSIISVEKLLKNFLSKLPDHDLRLHHVLFVPEGRFDLEERLKADPKIRSRIESITSLPFYWFPTVQPNFLQMSLPQLPSKMLIDGDWNYLHRCAMALLNLKSRMTNIPVIQYKGDWSAKIVSILKSHQRYDENPPSNIGEGMEINEIVLVDRWLDPLTPMLTSFSFGGTIDELYSIDVHDKVSIPSFEFENKGGETMNPFEDPSTDPSTSKTKDIYLNDEVFEQLQDLHINAVGAKLNQILKELREEEKLSQTLKSIPEYKNLLARLPKVLKRKTAVDALIGLTEIVHRKHSDYFFIEMIKCEQEILANEYNDKTVIPFIENAIIEMRDIYSVLRLIVMHSIIAKGLKSNVFYSYRKLFVQSYGVTELQWWLKLQLAGLICENSENRIEVSYKPPNYPSLSKRFRLDCPEVDEIKPSDTSYVYNGRASLLVRLIEEGLLNNWREFTKIEGFKLSQNEEEIFLNANKANIKMARRMLLFVVGGLTRAEISSLHCLTDQISLICTTANINGKSLLNSFRD